jgi:hypothetical protein
MGRESPYFGFFAGEIRFTRGRYCDKKEIGVFRATEHYPEPPMPGEKP